MTRMADASFRYFAPGASGYASMVLPGANQPNWPPVDESVVEPETCTEMIDGRIVHASPAHPPHADLHSRLDNVLNNCVATGYASSTDMLTRTSERWSFAADASIRQEGVDPATGARYLEELAFEIMHTQSMSDITARARQLVGRGVRRVFMIRVRSKNGGSIEAGPVMEWAAADDHWPDGHWIELAVDAFIEDPCLRCPVRVRALLDAAEAYEAAATGLLDRGVPVLKQMEEKAEARGFQRGSALVLREAVFDMCDLLAIELTPARRTHIETLDVDGLRALRDRLKTHRCWNA